LNLKDYFMLNRRSSQLTSYVVFLALFVTACTPFTQNETILTNPTPSVTLLPATNTIQSPTWTPSPSITQTSSPTISPSRTPTPSQTLEPSATPTVTLTANVQAATTGSWIVKYLILEGTGGPTGCGDSVVPVSTGIQPSGNIDEDVKVALKSLFSTGSKYLGELYNPLYQSKLTINKIDYRKQTGEITVYLTGGFTKPKDDCDKLRYRAQVWDTIRQFPEIWRAYVWVNDKLLGDLLVVGDN
jgi:hypothetical protein